MLNVYSLEPTYEFAGGVLLVAAKTAHEAQKFIETQYGVSLEKLELGKPSLIRQLTYNGKEGVILDRTHYE